MKIVEKTLKAAINNAALMGWLIMAIAVFLVVGLAIFIRFVSDGFM